MQGKIKRRTFMHLGALGAAGATMTGFSRGLVSSAHAQTKRRLKGPFPELEEVSIAQLQQAMVAGRLTSGDLVRKYIARIKALDRPKQRRQAVALRSVLQINPDALEIAAELDKERKSRGPRGPLHGIPILVKDNIGTADRMETSAGSLALLRHPPSKDATVVRKLREAGAVILGKTNLSEWANFRAKHSSSGWSGRGGQGRNPYVLDRNPCGSSSGSAQAVCANLAAASLGTETDGSIVCPATACGVVGIKPTVGLTSRFNVIPISHTQDTVGPHGRTVADAATVFGALTGPDPSDSATEASSGKYFNDYTKFLDPKGLKEARIGIPRKLFGFSPEADAITNAAIDKMRDLGAVIVDPADIPTSEQLNDSEPELEVLLYEFKDGINKYLASLESGAPRTLADLIKFNQDHAEQELKFFGQDLFERAQAKDPIPNPDYLKALDKSRTPAVEGINAILDGKELDALVAPTGSPAWPIDLINGDHFLGDTSSPAARAGYPLVSVPAGFCFGLPVNITFMGRAFSEPTLIKLAFAFEQATKARRAPRFQTTLQLP